MPRGLGGIWPANARIVSSVLKARALRSLLAASICVEHATVELSEGDALIVEPGEAHTLLSSSDDYLHFVIPTPGLAGAEARLEELTLGLMGDVGDLAKLIQAHEGARVNTWPQVSAPSAT